VERETADDDTATMPQQLFIFCDRAAPIHLARTKDGWEVNVQKARMLPEHHGRCAKRIGASRAWQQYGRYEPDHHAP
jgi:hypothetical protein